jgi:hypothetical protein
MPVSLRRVFELALWALAHPLPQPGRHAAAIDDWGWLYEEVDP